MAKVKESPGQTAGPYVHIGCLPNFSGIQGVYDTDLGAVMVGDQAKGERITITGHVFDGAGEPLRDAMLETWQADADGVYGAGRDPHFAGWGRAATDLETDVYQFETIRPGAADANAPPMITFWGTARGINLGLHTRMYFPEDNPKDDAVLTEFEDKQRIATLIAVKMEAGVCRFDIRLQGDAETVFFDI